jgi:F-type H+-transporting ATPase subunit epsilon
MLMTLNIFLPFQRLVEQQNVTRVVIETIAGSFGVLPRRLDFVAALEPGLLSYEVEGAPLTFVAVDEGVCVKVGAEVRVSVRRAIKGGELSQLRSLIHSEFKTLTEKEKAFRRTTASLEVGLLRRLEEIKHDTQR